MLLCVDYHPLSLLSFTRDGIDCLRLLYKCRRAVCGNKYSKIVVACPSSDFPVPSSIVMQRILTFFTCQFRYLNYEISFIFIVIFCHFAPVLCPHDYYYEVFPSRALSLCCPLWRIMFMTSWMSWIFSCPPPKTVSQCPKSCCRMNIIWKYNFMSLKKPWIIFLCFYDC